MSQNLTNVYIQGKIEIQVSLDITVLYESFFKKVCF